MSLPSRAQPPKLYAAVATACLTAPFLAQVVRCFEDDDVIHVAGRVDPVTDIDVINFELALSDITQVLMPRRLSHGSQSLL